MFGSKLMLNSEFTDLAVVFSIFIYHRFCVLLPKPICYGSV